MARREIEIELGRKYTETRHGRRGIAVAIAHYLTGCSQVSIEWLGADGEVKDAWIDITEIAEITESPRENGGPQKTPPRL